MEPLNLDVPSWAVRPFHMAPHGFRNRTGNRRQEQIAQSTSSLEHTAWCSLDWSEFASQYLLYWTTCSVIASVSILKKTAIITNSDGNRNNLREAESRLPINCTSNEQPVDSIEDNLVHVALKIVSISDVPQIKVIVKVDGVPCKATETSLDQGAAANEEQNLLQANQINDSVDTTSLSDSDAIGEACSLSKSLELSSPETRTEQNGQVVVKFTVSEDETLHMEISVREERSCADSRLQEKVEDVQLQAKIRNDPWDEQKSDQLSQDERRSVDPGMQKKEEEVQLQPTIRNEPLDEQKSDQLSQLHEKLVQDTVHERSLQDTLHEKSVQDSMISADYNVLAMSGIFDLDWTGGRNCNDEDKLSECSLLKTGDTSASAYPATVSVSMTTLIKSADDDIVGIWRQQPVSDFFLGGRNFNTEDSARALTPKPWKKVQARKDWRPRRGGRPSSVCSDESWQSFNSKVFRFFKLRFLCCSHIPEED